MSVLGGTLGNLGVLWDTWRFYKVLLGILGTFGYFWLLVATSAPFSYVWLRASTCGYFLQLFATFGYLRKSLVIFGDLW